MSRRRLTMTDIARRAGVSKNAVSLALRHDRRIPIKTRRRIERLARSMGYHKNATVAHLMAELSRSQTPAPKATLALLNVNPDPTAFTSHPTLPVYVEGCRRRAQELGYALDYFWLYQAGLDGERLNEIYRNRNIQGSIIVGSTKTKKLPDGFVPTWEQFPAVVAGIRTHNPTLSFSCTDHHMLAIHAFEKALALGYRRPAMVLDIDIHGVVDGRFAAGLHIAQQQLPPDQRISTFYLKGNPAENENSFRKWFQRERPDLILTLYNIVHRWMKALKLRIPDEVGLIQLEWRSSYPECAGMNQHNEIVGAAAVEMVINMIHNHPPGLLEFPLATLVGGTWVDGETVRKINSQQSFSKRVRTRIVRH